MEISKELKWELECSQNNLKNAIRNHQNSLFKLRSHPFTANPEELKKAEEEIISIGLQHKFLIEKLREEYKTYQKNVEAGIIKNGIEERRFNLTNALNRARKQNISITRSASANSISDESVENIAANSSQEHSNPIEPHEITQAEFLNYFNLATHEIYKEMQNKRAERKRRSTANPQFLYGNKGWDFLSHNKRKRNTYFLSQVSPPHTRQFIKEKMDKTLTNSVPEPRNNVNKPAALPLIPNLPSGLIIERISPESVPPDLKECVVCKETGVLSVCEVCSNGFHISCHNRPLIQTPRHCPNCISKEVRTIGSLNVPSGMTVSYITSENQDTKPTSI